MPSYVTPKKDVAFVFYGALTSQANPLVLQANPTLAAGDVIVQVDGVSLGNITTLPSAVPAAGTSVKVQLTADEMNGDNIIVKFSDVAGAEWCDLTIAIQTTAQQIDTLASSTIPVVSVAGNVGGNVVGSVATVTQLTAAIADSVPADGTRPSIAQALYMLVQFLCERSITGTTMTVNKPDGTTALMTFTLNDAANPTSLTRAS